MHVAFRESPRHLESSFTSRLLPCTTSRSLLGGTDINSHKFPFKRARIHHPLATPSPFSKAKDSVCLLIRVCKERYSSFPSTKRSKEEERKGAARRRRGNKRLRDLAIFNDSMKAGEIRKERIVSPRVFENREGGKKKKKNRTRLSHRTEKWLLCSRTLNFALKIF